jgi:hypothetical protein
MISWREQLIRAVLHYCTAAIAPIRVLRQPVTAIPRDQAPALILSVTADAPISRHNERIERELVLRLTAYARDPTDGYAVADDLLCRAHIALLAEPTLGGLALAVTEMEADYQAEDADVEAIAIPATYRITYRTLVSDISQGG